MISYARMYGGKNPDAIRTAFVSCGADPDEIIIDEPKPRSADFNLTQKFLEYKRDIISKIR